MDMPASNIVETPKAPVAPAPAAPVTPPAPSTPTTPAAAAPDAPDAKDAKPEEPKADTKEGRLLQQIRAKERANVEKTQQLQRQAEELKAREQRFIEQAQTSAQRDKLAQADPLEYLRKVHGWTDEQIAARMLNKGAPPPDEARDRRIKELEQKLTAREEQDAKAAHAAKLDAAVQSFLGLRTDNADKWPLAAKISESRLKARALEISRADPTLSDPDIYDRIEDELSDLVKLTQAPATKTPKPAAASPQEHQGKETTTPAPTLAGASSAPASPPAKVDVLKMTPEQLNEHTRAELKRLRDLGQLRD